ncbi:MAG: AAA family ATPase [Candidatus Saccharimonadales bacterium]
MSDTGIQNLIKKGQPAPPSKFIIMGEPMSGKTTLAAKAPKPLFISTDGNAAKAGLDAVNADSLKTVKLAIDYFVNSEEYDTLVIDTVEGIADLFEKTVIDSYQQETGQSITSLNDVPYGKLTGQFNRRMAAFAETLWIIPKSVMILTYTKRQMDDLSGSIILASELKSIRQFTRFSDGIILTSYDGEKYRAQVVSKRTVMSGEVQYGSIEPFLKAAGWSLPARKTKVGSARKGQ